MNANDRQIMDAKDRRIAELEEQVAELKELLKAALRVQW
jgi:uncharacterized protein YceH (UPF0502 family)